MRVGQLMFGYNPTPYVYKAQWGYYTDVETGILLLGRLHSDSFLRNGANINVKAKYGCYNNVTLTYHPVRLLEEKHVCSLPRERSSIAWQNRAI